MVASYLAQADALLHQRAAYDLGLGTTIVPFVKHVGQHLNLLHEVGGAVERVQRMLLGERSDPVGTFFELAAAARYGADGYDVEFVPESPGVAKTPDFRIRRDGAIRYVECKRLRSSAYEAREKAEQKRLFDQVAEHVLQRRASVHIDVSYRQELATIPDQYLVTWAERALNTHLHLPDGYPWEDEFGRGVVRRVDLAAVGEDTQQSDLFFGPKLARLLIGYPVVDAYSMAGDFTPSRSDPRFISRVQSAVVATWRCEARLSIDAKTRHIKSKLAELDTQLMTHGEGIGHIGVDAYGGADVSDLRRSKNRGVVMDFQHQTKMAALYLHYFVFRITEVASWMVDETVDFFGSKEPLPLSNGRLFTASETLGNALPAWRQAQPEAPVLDLSLLRPPK